MIFNDTYKSNRTGITWDVKYEEMASFDLIQDVPVGAEGAFCFCNNKLVLVYSKKRDSWEIPGGGREEGESFEECIAREIKEESNMKVLELIPLGYDIYTSKDTSEINHILRYAAKVEPLGDFAGDGAPDGEITDMKLINPSEYKQYFDWHERGDAMMSKAMNVLNIVNP
jgi:8-oxo-dGTP pyrophosphatase MutT (NUDIX family)